MPKLRTEQLRADLHSRCLRNVVVVREVLRYNLVVAFDMAVSDKLY
jgi:hypothetical protein